MRRKQNRGSRWPMSTERTAWLTNRQFFFGFDLFTSCLRESGGSHSDESRFLLPPERGREANRKVGGEIAMAGGTSAVPAESPAVGAGKAGNRLFPRARSSAKAPDGYADKFVHESGRKPVHPPGHPRFKGTYDNRFIASNPPQQGLNSVVQIHDLHG